MVSAQISAETYTDKIIIIFHWKLFSPSHFPEERLLMEITFWKNI